MTGTFPFSAAAGRYRLSFIGVPVLEDLCSSFRSLPPKLAMEALVVNVSAILQIVEVLK